MNGAYGTVSMDAWDVVALKVYGDEGLMGALIPANAEHAETVLFSSGVTLVVPPRPARSGPAIRAELIEAMPAWRR